MSINRLIFITMSDDYGTGYHGSYEPEEDSSKLRTEQLAEELHKCTIGESYAIIYPDGSKVPWLVDIIKTILEPKTLTCENNLLLKNDDCESLFLKLKDLIKVQEDIKREPCVLVIVAYYPKYESPPFVNLGIEYYGEDGWIGYKVSDGRSMIWTEYIKNTRT